MSRFMASKAGLSTDSLDKLLPVLDLELRPRTRTREKAPRIEVPRSAAKMKSRPISTEEFERMLSAVEKVRPTDPKPWRRLLMGLWLSGLRIGEAVALDWGEGPFQFDTTGRHPAPRIEAAGQKSGRAEYAPMTPDFAEWALSTTPEAERVGPVLPAERLGRCV